MSQNRLHLDFSLQYRDERTAFLNIYLQRPEFVSRPPTEEELETMGNYLLWGKDRQSGLNAKQEGDVQLQSKHTEWDPSDDRLESLDALMESPTFNEASLREMTAPAIKVKREVFSREEALANCPESMIGVFKDLFRSIDELDLKINYYELAHNRRQNPPRPQLLRHFSEEEQHQFQEKVTHWGQFMYLKQRHELVELRRQQYTLRDSYMTTVRNPGYNVNTLPPSELDWDAGIEVLPLGIVNKNLVSGWIFRDIQELIPDNYNEEQLRKIYQIYWEKKKWDVDRGHSSEDLNGMDRTNNGGPQSTSTSTSSSTLNAADPKFDFRNPDHIYRLFSMYDEMDTSIEEELAKFDSNRGGLMRALKYYMGIADLNEVEREILDLRLKKVKNADIAATINQKWGKQYGANYISTIFKQRIIGKINEAVKYHEKIIENLCFEEEWKICSCCGKKMLRDEHNFTRKNRSKDGFTARCKKCEKIARNRRNNE